MRKLPSYNDNKGFTLLETLIVIAVFAIGAAIAIPAIMEMGKKDEVKSAARQLKDHLAQAKMSAIEQNVPVVVTFVSDTNTYSYGTTSIDLTRIIKDGSLPDESLTWDERGYPDKSISIPVEGKGNSIGFNVTVSVAGGINITK